MADPDLTAIDQAMGPRKPDGGQAFPVPAGNFSGGESWDSERGMSLRDYFAAKAMAAYVAKEGPASDEDGDFVARYAYEIADAMLVERERREGQP